MRVALPEGGQWEYNWYALAFYDYDPYGKLSGQWEYGGSVSYKYTGKERLGSGHDYFGARYYDGQNGALRWISPDRITNRTYDPPALNKYSYCRNDCINLVDPDGQAYVCSFQYRYSGESWVRRQEEICIVYLEDRETKADIMGETTGHPIHSVLGNCAQTAQNITTFAPRFESMFNCRDHILDCRKVPVVRCKTTGQLPNPFDRIEVGAVRRQVFELEKRRGGIPPFLVQRGMVIPQVVRNHDDPPAGAYAERPQLLQEGKARFGIEATRLSPEDHLAVTQPYGSKIPDALPRRMMQEHWIRSFRRNPHPAPRTMLLEVNLIHRPEVNVFAACQAAEFFLPGPDLQGWLWRSGASVSAGEIRVAGTTVDIAVRQVRASARPSH